MGYPPRQNRYGCPVFLHRDLHDTGETHWLLRRNPYSDRVLWLVQVSTSYFPGARFGNVRDMKKYLQAPCNSIADKEIISGEDEAYEYAMMHLRLSEGFSLLEYESRFGTDFLASRREKIKTYQQEGLISIENGRIFLSEDGFYLSNSIMADII